MREKPRWEEEVWKTVTPPDDIFCKTCIFRLQPVVVGGDTFERHTYASCRIYESPNMKPRDVLWDGAECEYYEKEIN